MRWRIFYADGSTFDHTDGPPSASPTVGVVVVVSETPDRIEIIHQCDFYWWNERWYGGDVHGFIDQAARFGASWVRQGQTIRFPTYESILGAAVRTREEWL